MCTPDPTSAARRALLRGLAGAAAASLVELGGLARRSAPGLPTLACADRDGGAIVELDRDLFPVRRSACAWPVALAADGGSLWAVSAADGLPRGRHRLVRFGPDGEADGAVALAGPARVATLSGGGVAVLERPGAPDARVLRASGPGPPVAVARVPGASALVAATDRRDALLVGGADGELVLLDPACGAERARARLPAPVVALAPAPRGRWWVAAGDGTVVHAGPDLAVRAVAAAGARPVALASVPGTGRAWVATAGRPAVLRVGTWGRVELTIERLAARGVADALATPDGGVLLATPGALLALDPGGRPRPGQGGFAALVAVVRAG